VDNESPDFTCTSVQVFSAFSMGAKSAGILAALAGLSSKFSGMAVRLASAFSPGSSNRDNPRAISVDAASAKWRRGSLPLSGFLAACLLGIQFCIGLILRACGEFFAEYNKCGACMKPVKAKT
jgi:hypothetical protein